MQVPTFRIEVVMTTLICVTAMGCPSRPKQTAEHDAAPSALSSTTSVASSRVPSPSTLDAALDAARDVALEIGPGDATTDDAVVADALSCPKGMLPVQGGYCPNVEQRCLEFAKDKKGKPEKTRCLRFEKPSRCLSPRRMQLRFCVDQHEYPNRPGEKPLTLVNWRDAKTLCEKQGKRLCTEFEFNFACEGEEMIPYATGYERDDSKCSIDHPFRTQTQKLKPYEECVADKQCAAEFARLDQRSPSGSHPQCRSPFGIEDMNGNVNEWVAIPYRKPPQRSGLKGGWWGPVRNRCRPIARSHDELYIGYEVGFRCCWGTVAGRRKWQSESSRAR